MIKDESNRVIKKNMSEMKSGGYFKWKEKISKEFLTYNRDERGEIIKNYEIKLKNLEKDETIRILEVFGGNLSIMAMAVAALTAIIGISNTQKIYMAIGVSSIVLIIAYLFCIFLERYLLNSNIERKIYYQEKINVYQELKDTNYEVIENNVSESDEKISEDNIKVTKTESINKEEIEYRRGQRFGGIISIFVIFTTMVSSAFTLMNKIINVWPIGGIIYQYFHLLVVVSVTVLVLLVIEMIIFFCFDLLRHNIKHDKYKMYDIKSDNMYDFLIHSIYISLGILVAVIMVAPFIFFIEEGVKPIIIFGIICSITFFIIAIKCLYTIIKKIITMKKFYFVKNWGINIIAFLICGLLIYEFALVNLIKVTKKIDICYEPTGIVSINQETNSSWADAHLFISDEIQDSIIWEESVASEDMLMARKDKYINGNIEEGKQSKTQGVFVDGEKIYALYKCKLPELEAGRYCLKIIFEVDNKKIEVLNMFQVSNSEFIFAKEIIENKY